LLLANVSSYLQVGQFKHLLGVKPTPQKDLWNTPLLKLIHNPLNWQVALMRELLEIERILG
jgi:hypothetical protein